MIKNKGCCSLELAKQIKELGVVQKSIWHYYDHNTIGIFADIWKHWKHWTHFISTSYDFQDWRKNETISTFSVAELEMLLPEQISPKEASGCVLNLLYCKVEDMYIVAGQGNDGVTHQPLAIDKINADAKAACLIYLIENDIVKVENLNKLLEEN